MKNKYQHKEELPAVSIEEALRLYLSVAMPQGIPDDIAPDVLLANLKAYIANDRPDWHEKFAADETLTPKAVQQSYSKIKQEIIQQALKAEIPQDLEERYLYERRQEALKNRQEKNAEEKEDSKKAERIRRILEHKKQLQEDQAKKKHAQIEQLKNELKKRLAHEVQKMQSDTESLSHEHQVLALSEQAKLKNQYSNRQGRTWNKDALKWNPSESLLNQNAFKNSELSDNQKDKLVALDTFHAMRRQNMYKRSEVVKPLTFERTTHDVSKRRAEAKEKWLNDLKFEPEKGRKHSKTQEKKERLHFDSQNANSSVLRPSNMALNFKRSSESESLSINQRHPRKSDEMDMSPVQKFNTDKLLLE